MVGLLQAKLNSSRKASSGDQLTNFKTKSLKFQPRSPYPPHNKHLKKIASVTQCAVIFVHNKKKEVGLETPTGDRSNLAAAAAAGATLSLEGAHLQGSLPCTANCVVVCWKKRRGGIVLSTFTPRRAQTVDCFFYTFHLVWKSR